MAATTMLSFFKVMINDFSHKLTLPPLLVSKFGNMLPNYVKLRMSNGVTWNIEIEETKNGDRCLTNGWKEFVKDMKLVEGDYVCFYPYIDGMTFDIVVFGTNCCEKMMVFESEEKHGCNVIPRFEVLLKDRQASRLPLRKTFVKKAGLLGKNEVILEYGPTKKTSAVALKNRSTRATGFYVDLALGWHDFQKENRLKVGKTYSFTFNKARNVIQVQPVENKF